MGTFWKWAVAVVVLAVWVAPVRSQEGSVPEGTTVKLLLLRQKSVQQELALSPDVTKKVMDFTTAQSEAAEKALAMGEAQRKQAFEKLGKQNEAFLASTLTPQQDKRLDQITMQFTALQQLAKPEIARALNLTAEQQQKFRDLQQEARKELVNVIHSKDAATKTQQLAELREKTRTSILALMTDEQKTKVRELAGPPFNGEIVFEEHN